MGSSVAKLLSLGSALLELAKGIPDVVRALSGKKVPLDPALGQSQAQREIEDADRARAARKEKQGGVTRVH